MGFSKWVLTVEEQREYTAALTEELPPLRAKAAISQAELANMVGVSRQTYSAIEGKRKPMSWSMFLSLIFFFDSNIATHDMLRNLPAYPAKIISRMNEGKTLEVQQSGQLNGELAEMMGELDEQALHTIKTMLLVEYARCKNIPGEVVVKAFGGMDLTGKASDDATERALKNIRNNQS